MPVPGPAPSRDPGRVLRIASYNIRKAVGLDWRRDPARILAVLNEIDADIVVLQEADKRLGQRPTALPRAMLERETDYFAADVALTAVSLGWHGNAVLLRRGMPVAATARLPLPGLEPRGAVSVRTRIDGREVTVIGVHLAILRRWRRLQLQAIRAQVDEAGIAHTVIAGDFNEWAPQGGMEALEDRFRLLAPGNTYHAGRPSARLDRIAYGGMMRPLAAGVHASARARAGSDHLPIWCDLGWHAT